MRKPHCCALCDASLVEVIRTHTDGPRAGEPSEIGQHHPHAWRATLVLASGAAAPVSVCEDCLPTVGDRLPELWRRCTAAAIWQEENRAAMGARPHTEEQAVRRRLELLALYNDVPIGVLAARRWQEIAHG